MSIYHDGSDSKNFSILEGLGGGVAMFDYDNDGWLDLLFPSGGNIQAGQPLTGLASSLWRNVQGSKFEIVASKANIEKADYFSHGLCCADVDNDGFTDVLLTGYGGLHYFHNQGDGTFLECAVATGLRDDSWSTSAAWFDLNRDGNLDLFVTHYVDWSWDKNPQCGSSGAPDRCTPYDFNALTDSVFLADGAGEFTDVSSQVGLVEGGKGLGVVAGDFDANGFADVYVANDTTNNFYYENSGDGQLKETGLFNGTALDERGIPNGSMGIAVSDFNLDERPDLWVTNFENETCAMYQNSGDAGFRCVSNSLGVNALGKLFVGFGTVATDIDLDGFEDLVVANGHLQNYAPLAQEQLILRNDGGKRFVRIAATTGYFSQKHIGRGLVAGDLDRDGRLDLVFSNSMEKASLLLNRTEIGDRRWISMRLSGKTSSRDAIGARIVLQSGNVKRARYVVGGASYLSQGPYTLHWGLPEPAGPLQATIRWPSGVEQVVADLRPQTVNVVVEPD